MAAGTGAGPGPSVSNPLVSAGSTNISIQTTYNPLTNDILVIKGISILDAIFVNKVKGKPAYITTTSESATVLWQVGPTGDLQEIAKILWEAGSSPEVRPANQSASTGNRILVSREGREEEADVYGQRSKGIFSKSRSTLTVDGRKYSWHSGLGSMRELNTSVVDGWKCLVATDPPPAYDFGPPSSISISADGIDMSTSTSTHHSATDMSTPETTNEAGANSLTKPPKSIFRWNGITRKGSYVPKEIVLRFIPPSSSLVHGEFILNTSLFNRIDTFLISAILLATSSGDWKYTQSTTHPREMETVLRSDHAGDLPPYSPSTPGNRSTAGIGVTGGGGRRPSHNLHRTISDGRQWRWTQDFNPGNQRRRSNSSAVPNRELAD